MFIAYACVLEIHIKDRAHSASIAPFGESSAPIDPPRLYTVGLEGIMVRSIEILCLHQFIRSCCTSSDQNKDL